jgi:hypothetical protein
MMWFLLWVGVAQANDDRVKTPKQDADRAALGVVVGELYGSLVIGLGGWWLSSQISPTEGMNSSLMYTAPAGAAIGGVLGGAMGGRRAWAPVGGMTAVPMGVGLGVAAAGASRGNRPVAAVGIGVMAFGAPLTARYTALHLANKRSSVTVQILPTDQGVRIAGQW